MTHRKDTVMADDQLLVDVLRAAGHEDAADLASKLIARDAQPETAKEPDAAPAKTFASQEEADRYAEGQALLAAMQRDLGVGR